MTIQPIEKPGPASLEARMRYAEVLADSNLLPAQYRKNPANVLLAQELGDALGIPAIQAINAIHVIEGKPSAGADLMASIVRRAGHRLRIIEGQDRDGPTVTAQLIRSDDPDFTFTSTWTMAQAKAAKLTGKDNWIKYPKSMLRARAIMEVCRAGASEAMYGVNYTAEELEDIASPASTGTATQARDFWAEADAALTADELTALWSQAHRAGQLDERLQEHMRQRKAALVAADGINPVTGEVVEAEIVEDSREAQPAVEEVSAPLVMGEGVADAEGGEAAMTPRAAALPSAQRKATQAAVMQFERLGIVDRDERLMWTALIVGREIASTNDLTVAELRDVVGRLGRLKDRTALEALGAVLEAEREGQSDE